MRSVLVVVASLAVLAGLMAPTGAAAKTRSAHPSAVTNSVITGTTSAIQDVLQDAVACVHAAVGGASANPTTTAATLPPGVRTCIRTALRSVRTIINSALDKLQGSAPRTPQVTAAFAQLREALAAAFDKLDAQFA